MEAFATRGSAPPASRVTPLEWLRANLFSSPANTLLTLASAYVLYLAMPPLVSWSLIHADWAGTTREDCTGGGACWVFVRARFDQFMYGFYPHEERWRVDLAFGLLALLAALVLVRRFPFRKWSAVVLIVAYPPTAYLLFVGGALGLPHVETARWGGLSLTLVIAGVGMAASFPLGVLLALGRRSALPAVRLASVVFIEFWRGVPLITVLFMASVMLPLFLPEGVTLDKLLRALIGVALFQSAYMAEVVRGGLQAVPKGQVEAAAALGLGYWKTMGLVVLPQALRHVIPGIVNTFIALFKDTTLVLIIGLFDLLGIVQAAITDPKWLGMSVEGYMFAGLGFWIFCFAMSRYSQYIERRLAVDRPRR